MVIDTSAIIAILFNEPDALDIARAIEAASIRRISAARLLETAIVVEARHGLAGGEKLDQFINSASVQIEPATVEQSAIARMAYRRYGKGRHPAGLNYGDCFAYALAKAVDEPLLFKGADFVLTDIEAVT